jgi:hypothetical protein
MAFSKPVLRLVQWHLRYTIKIFPQTTVYSLLFEYQVSNPYNADICALHLHPLWNHQLVENQGCHRKQMQ